MSRLEFFSLGAVDILGQVNVCVKGILGYLAASLASISLNASSSPHTLQICVKLILVEKH